MNQGKLEVVKQQMARVNIDILGVSELKWTGMGEFNSDDHHYLLLQSMHQPLLLLSRFNRVRLCATHRWQPTRLRHPWDSPGKNTGVACHFLLQCMKVKNKSEVTQSCLTLQDPRDCSLPGSSVHWIFQERVLEWVAIAFSTLVTINLKESEDSILPYVR